MLKKIKIGATFLSSLDAIESINQAYKDCKVTTEIEKTNRQEIEAKKQEELARIKATRKIFLKHLDHSFREREKLFEELFSQAEEAIKNNDNNQLNLILTSITELAKSSPFKNINDVNSVQLALKDKNHTWEF